MKINKVIIVFFLMSLLATIGFTFAGMKFAQPKNSVQTGSITIRGRQTCLSKPGNGPTTLECAIGIKTSDGKEFGLEDPTSNYQFISQIVGEVEVTGELRPPSSSTYKNVGTIKIESVKKIAD